MPVADVMWSWRESNPRPNRETIRFLHAYSSLRFSCSSKTWTTNWCLILLISSTTRGCNRLFPNKPHRLTLRLGKRSLERCLVPSPGDGIKPVIYCTSIRQRERNLFRQINFLTALIMEYTATTPHAYASLQPAVKSSQPHFWHLLNSHVLFQTANIHLFLILCKFLGIFCKR